MLSEAILEIVEGMEKDASMHHEPTISMLITSYAKQLRVAVKASSGNQIANPLVNNPMALNPAAQHALEIEKARSEFKGKVQSIDKPNPELEAIHDGRMIVCKGGKSDGDTINMPADIPKGAKTFVGGEVYILSADGMLVFSQSETNKALKQKEESKKNEKKIITS